MKLFSRFFSRVVFLLPALLAGCAWYSVENGYVFTEADAIDPFMPAPINCDQVKRYHNDESPDYFALYKPEADLRTYLSLVPSTDRDILIIGPGVVVPLPVIPTVWGETEALTHARSSSHKALTPFRLAVYPYPHKTGYTFDPHQVRIKVGEDWLAPVDALYYRSHNRALQPAEQVKGAMSLPAHSGEYQMYLLQFATDRKSPVVEAIRMTGFARNGEASSEQDYNLLINKAGRFDWKMETCSTR